MTSIVVGGHPFARDEVPIERGDWAGAPPQGGVARPAYDAASTTIQVHARTAVATQWRAVVAASGVCACYRRNFQRAGSEWAAAQALAEPSTNWVALELMRDRAHSIFSRMVFEAVMIWNPMDCTGA